MKATDLDVLSTPGRPSIHPTDDVAVVSVTRPDLGADAYVGQVWSVPLDGGEPRRLTRGFRDAAPQYSPDGTLVAFVRSAPGEPPQLQVVAATGGEPVAVTAEKLGVSAFAWAPDSSRLAFVARVAEQGRYGTVPELTADAEPPRRFTTRTYGANGVGYTTDRRAALFVVDVPDIHGEPLRRPGAERIGGGARRGRARAGSSAAHERRRGRLRSRLHPGRGIRRVHRRAPRHSRRRPCERGLRRPRRREPRTRAPLER